MKGYLDIALVFCCAMLALLNVSFAQEQGEEEAEYTWGIVSSISAQQIVLSEYDYDTDEEVNVAYTLDPDLELKNLESLEEIVVGSDVWVDYVVKDGKKIAVGIELRMPSSEESTPWETEEEE